MRETTIEATSVGETTHKCIDRRGSAGTEYLIIIDMESGNGIVTFEFSPEEDCPTETPMLWIEHDVLNNITESCASTINVPFQSFRLNVKNYIEGTIKAKVVQGGYHGN